MTGLQDGLEKGVDAAKPEAVRNGSLGETACLLPELFATGVSGCEDAASNPVQAAVPPFVEAKHVAGDG